MTATLSKLTPRQRHAYDELLARELDAMELGRLSHAHHGGHDFERPCGYCAHAGAALIDELDRFGLVERVGFGNWRAIALAEMLEDTWRGRH